MRGIGARKIVEKVCLLLFDLGAPHSAPLAALSRSRTGYPTVTGQTLGQITLPHSDLRCSGTPARSPQPSHSALPRLPLTKCRPRLSSWWSQHG